MTENKYKNITLNLLPEQAADYDHILKTLRKDKSLKDFNVRSFKIVRRSIDARKKQVMINLGLIVSEEEEISCPYSIKEYKQVSQDAPHIIIIGAGPAGLFAGLRAIEYGIKPIILERGKEVDSRRIDVANISRKGEINPDSNYCFGEGGAGTFSDGKLYTRSKKRGNIKEVLEILHQFGASEEILINSHPHIGSDKLPKVIMNIREKIKECGGEVKFNCRMEELLIKDKKTIGVKTSAGEIINGPVVLATGHSARDTYRMLKKSGVSMESKGLAIGVRLEHPQWLIDKMQYHKPEGRGEFLPPAEYSFVHQANGRGVYSFCMCPGGVVVPSVSEEGQIVVNGMSASSRSGRWANAGYVVELHPGDIKGFEKNGELEMMELQEYLEKRFSEAGNNTLKAPAQKIKDFLNGNPSCDLPSTSYPPGIYATNFHNLFPSEISERLKSGLLQIGEKCKDFIKEHGIMIGLESRTSSPLRIPRNADDMEHIEIANLYPAGEGAGYAGGIVSSAMDGMKCIDAFHNKMMKKWQ